MFSSTLMAAVMAAFTFSMASSQSTAVKPQPTPTKVTPARELTTKGCFSTPIPLIDYGPYLFQSEGNCQQICLGFNMPVMALSDGTNCWCGEKVPPANAKVADGNCSTTCGGGDDKTCGGDKHYFVELTGSSRNNIENYVPEVSSSSTSAPKATTKAAETAIVTQTTTPKESEGPNKAGIAAGVVVGVLVLAGIIAGVYFYLRRQRRKELEEEHRRREAVSSFVSGGKLHTSNSSMTDSRLDPEFMNRRQSNGSIADNEDYSRRILKVTNA